MASSLEQARMHIWLYPGEVLRRPRNTDGWIQHHAGRHHSPGYEHAAEGFEFERRRARSASSAAHFWFLTNRLPWEIIRRST